MDWYEDDELKKQCEEVSRVQEIFRQLRREGEALQFGAVQRVLELVTSQILTKGKVLEEKEDERKVEGWSTKEMDEKVSDLVGHFTEEMVRWRSKSQEEIDESWKRIA